MNITEVIREAWYSLSTGRRIILALVALVIVGMFAASTIGGLRAWSQTRVLEAQAVKAKREAQDALNKAAQIAREKLALEKQIAQIEVKRDAKEKEANDAHIKTLDARADYDRTLRESRGDNPDRDQLCAELDALGYPCE